MDQQQLPYFREFLLEMTNNNYSAETVFNYERDLHFFAAFLWDESKPFASVDKLTISAFKGYLRSGAHLATWKRYRDWLLANYEQTQLTKMGLTQITVAPETGSEQVDAEESSYKGSKSAFRRQEGLSPRSVNRMLSALRHYLKFLIDIDQPVPVPPDAVKLLKTERKESQVAEFAELVGLIESPENLETNPLVRMRNRAMLELLFSSGMRISELLNLDREQLNLYASPEYDQGLVAGKLYIKGKGKKSRFVYLTQRAKHWLERYMDTRHDQYPAVFVPYRGARAGTKDPGSVRISANYLQERIANYRRKLGIVVPTSAHSLRHGFATYLAEQGASPAAIQRLLGHESLQTTTRYVHTSDKFAEQTHRDFHPLADTNPGVGGADGDSAAKLVPALSDPVPAE